MVSYLLERQTNYIDVGVNMKEKIKTIFGALCGILFACLFGWMVIGILSANTPVAGYCQMILLYAVLLGGASLLVMILSTPLHDRG